MVERFHRQLKVSIRASDPVHWSETLPLVLLGIRTTIKKDLGHTSSEMIYGENVRLPGEFFVKSDPNKTLNPEDFVDQLRKNFENLRSVPTRELRSQTVYMPTSLENCEHVFVRVDRVKTGLQDPYDGPYKIVRRLRKYFIIMQNNKEVKVSIDRLKPAKIDPEGKKPNPIKKVRFRK